MYDAGSIQASLDLDRTPFQQSLKRATAEGNRFDGKKFTAKADLNTTAATAQAKRLEALLNKIRGKRAGAFVSVSGVARATFGLRQVDRLLDKIDGRRATAHVGLDKDGAPAVATMRLLGQSVQALVPNLQGLTTAGTTSGKAIEGLSAGSNGIALSFAKAGPLVAVLTAAVAIAVPVVVSLGAALVAIVASAAAATAGMGALAVAGGGALAAGLALGIGAMQRYKAQADKAGTAANGLKKALGGVKDAFAKATAPGSDAIFRGLSTMLRQVRPAITRLRSDFTALGRAVGGALRASSPQIKALIRSFGQLVRATAPLAGPLVRSLTALGQIFMNIATAAMPFLVSGAKSVARTLESWGKGTGAATLGKTIQGLIGHLRSWLALGKQVGRIFLGFFRAAAPAGKGLVDSMTRGAKALGDWIKANPDKIRKFFADTLPLARSLGTFLVRLTALIIRFGQAGAPVLVPLMRSFTSLIDSLGKTGKAFAPIKDILRGTIALFGLTTEAVEWLVNALTGNTLTKSLQQVGRVARAVMAPLRLLGTLFGKLGGITAALSGAVAASWAAIRGAVSAGANGARAAATRAWAAVKSATASAWAAATQIVTRAWSAIVGAVTGGAARVVGLARALPGQIKGALGNLGSLLVDAGRSLIEGLINGIKAAGARAIQAAQDIVGKIKSTVSSGFGIFSPSRVFHGYGSSLMEGLERGIRAREGRAVEAMAAATRRVSAAGRLGDSGGSGRGGNRAENALATVRRGIRAGAVDALLAIGRADDRIQQMLRRLPKGAKGKGLLQNVLGDLRELSAYERKVADIGDRLRELSKEATEGFIDRRLQDQLRAIATGPEAREMARLQGLDRETERGSRDAELAGQFDDARRMQNPRRADETEVDYEERRRRGEAQQREVEAERSSETRRRRIEDLERTMAGRTNTAEERAESARVNPDRETVRFGQRLETRLDTLLKQLGQGRIGPEAFQNRARRALGAGGVGFTLPYEDREALADKPDMLRGRGRGRDEGRDRGREDRRDQRENRREDARDERDKKREDARDRRDRGRGGARTVIENLHIKTIPAGQKPDGPYTAAQLSQLVRNLGGVPG